MGLFRPGRNVDERSLKTLNIRIAILVVGVVVAMAGIRTETSWLIYLAAGIFAVGVILRFVGR